MAANDIAERNIERLISEAYRPEPVDPAFIAETEEKLLAAARETVVRVTAQPVETPRVLRLRRRWRRAGSPTMPRRGNRFPSTRRRRTRRSQRCRAM